MTLSIVVYAMLTDVFPENQRYSYNSPLLKQSSHKIRSLTFFRLSALGLITEIVVPMVTTAMMDYSVWLPMMAGTLLLFLLPFAVWLFMPSDAAFHHQSPQSVGVEGTDTPSIRALSERTRGSVLAACRSCSISAFRYLSNHKALAVMTLTFFVTPLGRSAMRTLLLYTHRRFDWDYSKVVPYPHST